jgi:galactonate dehydratase
MKITNIRAEIINVSIYSNWIFVIAETDDGYQGFGEATLDGFEYEVLQTIDNLSSQIIGKDVLKDKLYPENRSGGMITAAATSGIDMAMWDLKGKALNVPVYQLLGGAIRNKIPVYSSFNRSILDRSPEGFAEMAKKLVDEGNRGLKCAPFDLVSWRNPVNQKKLVDQGIARFAAMREAVGDDIEIAVDVHWRMDMATSRYVVEQLKAYNPFWLETPIPEHKPNLIHQLKIDSGLRIAGCEMQPGAEECLSLIEHDSLDVYMPDVRYIGGITGLLKTSALLETYDLLISPHNMSGPISTAASMQVAAGMKNLLNMEYHIDEADWLSELSDHTFNVENGFFNLPDGPGLGVNLNLAIFRDHPYKKAQKLRKNMLGG